MSRKKWTTEEDDFLRKNFVLSNGSLAKNLKVDRRAIRRRYAALNIDRPFGRDSLEIARFSIIREKCKDLVPEKWFQYPALRREALKNEVVYYWTGEDCKKCRKPTIRYSASGKCKVCQDSQNKERNQRPEVKESNRLYAKKIRKEKPELLKKQRLQRYANDDKRQLLLNSAREWRRRNPEYFKNHNRNYAIKNPLDRKLIKDNRRARKMNANVILNEEEKKRIKKLIKDMKTINKKEGRIAAHIDHLLPLSKGGLHEPSNLQIISTKANLFWKDKVKCCPYPKPKKWNEPKWEIFF